MISHKRDGYDGVNKRQQHSREPGGKDSEQRISGLNSGGEAHARAHKHHSLDAEIRVTDFLVEYPAESAEKYRRAHLHRRL